VNQGRNTTSQNQPQSAPTFVNQGRNAAAPQNQPQSAPTFVNHGRNTATSQNQPKNTQSPVQQDRNVTSSPMKPLLSSMKTVKNQQASAIAGKNDVAPVDANSETADNQPNDKTVNNNE
jgi:hypothetical protein